MILQGHDTPTHEPPAKHGDKSGGAKKTGTTHRQHTPHKTTHAPRKQHQQTHEKHKSAGMGEEGEVGLIREVVHGLVLAAPVRTCVGTLSPSAVAVGTVPPPKWIVTDSEAPWPMVGYA